MTTKDSATQPGELAQKKQHHWVWWLIFGVLLAAVAALGYLYWQERNRPDAPVETKKQACICPQASRTSSIEAAVGKFKLSLQDYVIIRQHDGGFEGGPITSLSIGTKATTGTNVVDYPTLRRVDVQAQPLNGSYPDYVSNALAALQSPDQTELANMTVAGETARVFQLDGLFREKIIFFQHAGIVYKISALQVSGEVNDETQKMLDAVVAGFSFL